MDGAFKASAGYDPNDRKSIQQVEPRIPFVKPQLGMEKWTDSSRGD